MARKKYTTVGVTEGTLEILSDYRDSAGYSSFDEMIRNEVNAEFEEE